MLAKLIRYGIIALATFMLLAAPAVQPVAAARARTGPLVIAAVNWNGIQKGAAR